MTNEVDVQGVVFVVFGPGLAEAFDVSGVEKSQVGMEGGEVRVSGEVVEGMPPVETSGLAHGGEMDGLEVGQRRDELLLEGEKAGVVVVEGLVVEEPGTIRSLEANVEVVKREVKRE